MGDGTVSQRLYRLAIGAQRQADCLCLAKCLAKGLATGQARPARHARRLKRSHRAGLLAVGLRVAEVGLPHLLDQHAPVREPLREPGDNGPQQRVQVVVGWRTRLDKSRRAIGAASVQNDRRAVVQVGVDGTGDDQQLLRIGSGRLMKPNAPIAVQAPLEPSERGWKPRGVR